jgi:hypothetical protein
VADAQTSAPGTFRTAAQIGLFGFQPKPLQVTLRARSRGWRVGGAARTFAVALLVAPALAVVPPHAPWVIGALVAGGVLAKRRLGERFTVVGGEGVCPKCGAQLVVKSGRLRDPHPLPCESCHHESTLELPAGALEGRADAVG